MTQKILSEENEELKKSYISLLVLTKEILEACIDMLGFSAPDRIVKNNNFHVLKQLDM